MQRRAGQATGHRAQGTGHKAQSTAHKPQRAGQGRAGQGRAGQRSAAQRRAGQGRAGQGRRTGQGRARQGSVQDEVATVANPSEWFQGFLGFSIGVLPTPHIRILDILRMRLWIV